MAAEIGDLNIIQDEDTLRRMWQETEDFSRKKEIRLRMYRLREERLKSYYITRETTDSTVASRKPGTSSHAESLSDQGFLTMKTKEIRDSASPTLDLKQSNISSLAASSHLEQLANQNIVTSSRQTVEHRNVNSSGSLSNQQNQGQTSTTTTTTYETSSAPYDGNNTTIVSYDGQDLHNNHERSIKSVQSSATEKYCTSSKREVVTSSATTKKRQENVISSNYNTTAVQHANTHIIPDNADYRLEYVNQKTNDQNFTHHTNNISNHSQQAIEYYDTNISDSKIPDTRISSSNYTIQEHKYLRSSLEPSIVKDKISIENTVSRNNFETKASTNRSLETKSTTNRTVTESQQNVDRNIMNELHKLDSYLSTEAVTSSPVPLSPASEICTNEINAVDQNVNSKTVKPIEPAFSPTIQEPNTTTYQQAYSKISVDTSATHNAFASSLRASPDHSIASPGKRTPSKSSLDRSTPDRSPRISPEKNSCNDLSRKYTASFQNRVSRNSAHMRDSKSSSPTTYVEPRHRQRSSSSSSENDSEDSRATYDAKVGNSINLKSTNLSSRHKKIESTNSFRTVSEKYSQQKRYTSPTKSSGHTSEGSVEREIGKPLVKSPDLSPERSAFKPVTLNNHSKSTTTGEHMQTRYKKPISSQKKLSPEICLIESPTRQQPSSPTSKRQLSPRTTPPTHRHTTAELQDQLKTRKQSSSKLNTATHISSVETSQKTTTEIQTQPSHPTISSPVTGPQSSSKRQSSPQIVPSNICTVENTINRNQTEIKRQSSPQINISIENIYKPEPKRHPSLQTVTSTNTTKINNIVDQKELGIKPVIESESIKSTGQISQQKIPTTVSAQIADTVDYKQTELKKQTSTTSLLHNRVEIGDEPSKHNELLSQTISVTNNCTIETMQDIENAGKQKQLLYPQTTGLVHNPNKPSCDNQGPKKPKRQPSGQIISSSNSTITTELTDQTSRNIQKQTPISSVSTSTPALKKPSSTKITLATGNIHETEQTTCTVEKVPKKKKSSKSRQSSEKISKPNTHTVESIDVTVTDQIKLSPDIQQKNKTKKKTKSSPIIDGRIIDVDEEDVVEEIKVKNAPTNAELRLQNTKSKVTPTIPASSTSVEVKKTSNVPVPKQRSASHNEFTTPKKTKLTPTSVLADESTDESSTTSESNSEDESEEVIIEEIFDEFGTPIPRETNPLEVALKLEASIKSKEEIDREERVAKDISLIPEDEVNLQTKNQNESFIKQEKLIQEGDEDDCLPPVEQVLGKDVDKAALNDFLEWERKQSLHKHTQPTDTNENSQRKFTTAEKVMYKPEDINQQVIQSLQIIVKRDEKPTNGQQQPKRGSKIVSAEINKPLADKVITKIISEKKLVKEHVQKVPSLKSPAKKTKESIPNALSKVVTKQPSAKDVAETKKAVNVTSKITKQVSDRSLKEKNDKPQTRKLDHRYKTKSEVLIKPAKPLNIYQRRVTDQVRTNTIQRADINSRFNKENRDISRSSKTIVKDSPRNICKTIIDVTVAKNRVSKPTDKLESKQTISTTSTPRKIPQTTTSVKTRNSRDKVTVTRESPTKPTKAQLKSSQTLSTKKIIGLKTKKPKEYTVSESSTSVSSSSVENLHDDSTTTITTTTSARIDQNEFTECTNKRAYKENELPQKQLTSDSHLNVVVRMPSSSRETTPNKQPDNQFYPVTDESEDTPRYADRVTSPDNVELKRKSTNLSTFEKITDLDEEDETSDTDLANASVAERMTKFLESAKETTATKQITIVEDDLFQNREQAVSKTKEIFETIAKNQVPGSGTPVVKPPPIINRPSVFEAGATVVELGHDEGHKIVSKKLTEQDYEDYRRECEDSTRVDITKITRSFEDRVAESSKNVVNVRPKKVEPRDLSPGKEKSESNPKPVFREVSPKKSSTQVSQDVQFTENTSSKISLTSIGFEDNSKCGADFCTILSHTKPENIKESLNPSSGCVSPTLECKSSPKRSTSPLVTSPRTRSPTKERTESPTPKHTSPTKEVDICSRSVSSPFRATSPAKDVKTSPSLMKEKSYPNKPVLVQDYSSLSRHKQPSSPEVKHTTNTTTRSNSKGDVIQNTVHRYEIRIKSPTNSPALQQPIEITQVEVRPSKQVYEHTAITNVRSTSSKFTPVEETFNQKLSRYSEDNASSSLTKPTESSKRRAGKSPSPEKAPLELSIAPRKSPSPQKEVTRKSTSNVTNSFTVSTLKRQKSPSPEKSTSKLRNKFQTNATTVETKKKKFEKRLSTTGTDYQNRKKFFETNASHSCPKQNRPAAVTTTKYEISVKSTTGSEKPGVLSDSSSRQKSEKSPSRHSPSKSPERIYQPKMESTRKMTKETTTTATATTTTTSDKTVSRVASTKTTVEPKRFTSSPERVRGPDAKRKSPEKIIKKEPFGVTLRKTKTPLPTISTTFVRQTQRVGAVHHVEELFDNGKKIEEIFDLELLERMLEKSVQYDLRSRIRAQIRLVKRQLETSKTSRTPSPDKSSPTRKTKISTTSHYTPQSTSSQSRSEVDSRVSGSSSLDRRDKVKKRLFTDEKISTTSESKSYFTCSSTPNDYDKRPRNGSPVRISETSKLNQSTYQTDFGSALTTNNDCKSTTDSIISGYGVGPTDENGRPLFGLKALRTSSETKIAEEDLDKCTKVKTSYDREITDNSGRPLFGLKALQKSSNFAEDQFETSLNERQPSRKYDNRRSLTTENSSHVYSSRTAMRSDGSGNVSMYRDEVKGELFSKDGKEPTGKMIATRYAYHKPEGEEATVKTETTSSYLNSKSHSSEANQISDSDRQDKWKSSTSTSKLGSSSLIRKISNEHFEKAQRKFSSGDEATTTTAWNENDRKASVDSTSRYETSSSSSSRRLHKSLSKEDSSEKVYTQRYSTESTSSTKRESYGGSSPTGQGGEYGKVHTSSVSSSPTYGHRTNDDQPKVSSNDSLKDMKSKFQQATVSSSMKNVSKSPDGRISPNKLQTSRRSPDIETAGTQSSFSSQKTKTNNQTSDGSYYYETRSYTESSSSNSQDLLNRVKDSSFRPRSEYTDEENEAASLLNKLVEKPVSLRELQSVPKTISSTESTTSKAATLVRKFEKQQNKTKQNKEEIKVEQIWDEDQLRDLLEACTDYESRRQIRARLRAIMAENKADADVIVAPENADIAPKNDTSPTRTVTTSRSDSFSSVTKVQSKTSSTGGRMVKANSVTSPFSKFRQLERQNSLPSSDAPSTKIANPNLTRSATSIKDRLLNWVKAQTKEYERYNLFSTTESKRFMSFTHRFSQKPAITWKSVIANVQIDNFSTSWNNGLAFCALIHHFCPHAFDYNKLTPDQRRHNFELAFRVAEEEAGIVPLLDVEDMVAMLRPDWKCVFTYVQSVYQRFQSTSAALRP